MGIITILCLYIVLGFIGTGVSVIVFKFVQKRGWISTIFIGFVYPILMSLFYDFLRILRIFYSNMSTFSLSELFNKYILIKFLLVFLLTGISTFFANIHYKKNDY